MEHRYAHGAGYRYAYECPYCFARLKTMEGIKGHLRESHKAETTSVELEEVWEEASKLPALGQHKPNADEQEGDLGNEREGNLEEDHREGT